MRHAIFLPPFGPLADPRALMDLASATEQAGWDGMFLWDHILRPPTEPAEIADVWVCLSAMATTTTSLRLGPMVTPIVRRRPQKLAREITTLDHLSNGRIILGVGLGVDTGRELSAFGEVTDARDRGAMLDEGLAVLDGLLRGDEVDHHGRHYTADHVTYLPRSVQRPRPSIWCAARGGARPPVRRAASYDGLFPVEAARDHIAAAADIVSETRGSLDGFDIAVIAGRDHDVHTSSVASDLDSIGVTWAMHPLRPGATVADLEQLITRRPTS